MAQTNIRAWQADGQVWIVWESNQSPPEKYSIFQSNTLSMETEDWKLIGSLYPEHCVPYPIRTHLGQENQTWKIPNGNNGTFVLAENEGLFVKTIRQSEENYFAVLPCNLDECPSTISVDNTSDLFFETFDPAIQVRPHLQNELTFGNQQSAFVYSFWGEGKRNHNAGLQDFPIMGNDLTNGWPQYFAVWTGVNTDLSIPSPAVNWLHGGSGNFSQYLSGKRIEINIEPEQAVVISHHDDFYRYLMGQKIVDESNSWWFGWAKDHNPFEFDHSGPANSDTLINYSQRRIKWINDWLIGEEIIDAKRIAIQGYSVGSAGAFGMMKTYPDFFSSGSIFNCGQQGPDQASFGSFLLGTEEQNLPTNLLDKNGNNIHIHDLYDLETFTSNSDLPPINAWHGKNDINPTMGWDPELIELIRAAKAKGIGYNLFWDERSHPIKDIMVHWSNGPADENQTAKDDTKSHERYRNDQSYPVFYNYESFDIHHSNPGNGMTGTGNNNGDDWGTLGGYHEYVPDSIIDTANEWSCTYYLSGENARGIDRYAGTEDCIQSDFTIRRTQNFNLAPLEPYEWLVIEESGNVVASGNAIADQEGRAILEGLPACKYPQKFTIQLRRNTNQECDQLDELIPEEGVYCQSIMVNSIRRDFITIVPQGYNHDDHYGLLFAFHGGGGNFNNFAFGHVNENGGGREEFHERAVDEKLILIYPQALVHPEIQASSWNTFEYEDQSDTYADDFQFTIDLLNHHNSTLNIDSERIYASGYSKGGDFAQLVGRKLSCYFAGVASVGSSSGVTHELGSPDIQFFPVGENPVSVLMIKGDEDDKRPWIGGENNNGNFVPSGLDDFDQWIQNNQCIAQSTISEETIPNILTEYRNSDCNENAIVKMMRGHILEHVWPDEDENMGVNANKEFINFLTDLKNPNSCLTTGANGLNNTEGLLVYPNPASNRIYLDIEQKGSIRISDIQGNMMYSSNQYALSTEYDIDVSNFPAGFYVIRILNNNGTYLGSFIKL